MRSKARYIKIEVNKREEQKKLSKEKKVKRVVTKSYLKLKLVNLEID